MSEEEIEYLEEDEEIIQQILQKPIQDPKKVVKLLPSRDGKDERNQKTTSLLVERKISRGRPKRKAKTEESDSDYDPTEDFDSDHDSTEDLPSKTKVPTPARKRPRHDSQKSKTAVAQVLMKNPTVTLTPLPMKTLQVSRQAESISRKVQSVIEYDERKKFEIKIPEFEDPLCLPVRALMKNITDLRKLQQWNSICIDRYTKIEFSRPEPKNGRIIGSTRVITFKNIKNRNGETDLHMQFNCVTRTKNGKKSTEHNICVLPRYREKRVLDNYVLHDLPPRSKTFLHRYEALLTKENHDNKEVLVVYKPKDDVSAVYKMVMEERTDGPPRRVLSEVTAAMICAPCYQLSWRGVGTSNDDKSPIQCNVCNRTFVSVYNMLSHLKTHHKNEEVRRHKLALSSSLAKVVDYHYRCRICLEMSPTIQHLRQHVDSHKGVKTFKCEVGNHMAT